MKTIKKVQAIIYDLKGKKPYFLILHRVLRWKGWEPLKGTTRKGETRRQTLKREIGEETRLKNFKIIKSLGKKEKWEALGKKYAIVDIFLVRADMNEKVSLKQKVVEHDKYLWADKKTALKKLTWPKTKKILKQIKEKSLN
ncbi:hypothetical protein COW09_00755 [bacterium (Candidatus Moisslbacteria) CG12_big_fil_rev_8_21_14_0_65_36_11]|nr:NUDIX domain-containing protein [Candidatus Kuenenbacteria bacterium]OIP76591.1 MAG: hypothetical protein AUK09_01390 [Parcubacteria group bacterium CG2_30_36_38]PIV46031.1 MAG: hypothetical protein COS23_01325 [bacterium (Candidatus Moisslbacteria) CG02_land_8_20_14_3_00_36_53]PIW68002.1 MAG: hypothetical protein COW09_00755 [bacterium (Candidatus Moisslbacteria) CG12_big_fil_rev_8_21_14_0_65_36_11]PIZ90399.1 MAG: hypothetical protein COX87_00700 [bacterium (Candidatus Moisslbacteria) CG_4_